MLLNSLHRTSAGLRICLTLAAALSGVAMVGTAQAQGAYPTKPIRIVVGFAAGGPSDILARVAGAAMSKTLGEQVYVENRTGASGTSQPSSSRVPNPMAIRFCYPRSLTLSTRPFSRISSTRRPRALNPSR